MANHFEISSPHNAEFPELVGTDDEVCNYCGKTWREHERGRCPLEAHELIRATSLHTHYRMEDGSRGTFATGFKKPAEPNPNASKPTPRTPRNDAALAAATEIAGGAKGQHPQRHQD